MQMLVYENYNKFISATDTIRSMKSNVDGMDSNMQELQNIVGAPEGLLLQPEWVYVACVWTGRAYCTLCAASVADRSNAVNAKLQLRRDQIEELNQVCSWHRH